MRHSRLFAWLALAGGMAFSGATTLSAQDWRELFRDRNHVRQDYYGEYAMRDHIARDRAQLDEDIRCGRSEAAARDAADLARDQRLWQSSRQNLRYDQRDLRNDYYRQSGGYSYNGYRDYGYRGGWR